MLKKPRIKLVFGEGLAGPWVCDGQSLWGMTAAFAETPELAYRAWLRAVA